MSITYADVWKHAILPQADTEAIGVLLRAFDSGERLDQGATVFEQPDQSVPHIARRAARYCPIGLLAASLVGRQDEGGKRRIATNCDRVGKKAWQIMAACDDAIGFRGSWVTFTDWWDTQPFAVARGILMRLTKDYVEERK